MDLILTILNFLILLLNILLKYWYVSLVLLALVFLMFKNATISEMAADMIKNPIGAFFSILFHFPVRGFVTAIVVVTLVLTLIGTFVVVNRFLGWSVSDGLDLVTSETTAVEKIEQPEGDPVIPYFELTPTP